MVCDACQKKLTKIVGIDPYRNKAHNKLTGVHKRPPANQNKLLGSEKKATVMNVKCKICKCAVHQVGSHYCQTCAYQKGICAIYLLARNRFFFFLQCKSSRFDHSLKLSS
ncbi:hypothetical protein Y032_0003g1447 [Ancylostoma ceylanicum]|uniref:Cysteine-rich PDZ-binding protein n=1 Tax=Ancylostoma ceylanicum TaxID=53326 RepID=A0A016VZJ9_9BILA|nr:hypothetical protein Y032_0003g1447 [Ancylostoma ceylanicum]